MKKLALLFPLGAVMAAAVWAFAAGDAGDPLASLSYLRSDFTQTVEQKVDKALDTSDAELRTRLEDGAVADLAAAWQEVRLKEGDTLQGVTGTNVLTWQAACGSPTPPVPWWTPPPAAWSPAARL